MTMTGRTGWRAQWRWRLAARAAAVFLLAALARADVPAPSIGSNEAQRVVAREYRRVLGREPDAGGLDAYTRALVEEGRDASWLRAVLQGSQEGQRHRRDRIREARRRILWVAVPLGLVLARRWCLQIAIAVLLWIQRACAGRRPAPWMASWRAFCLGVGLLFLVRGFIFLSLSPPLEGFDEHQHIGYLVHLAERGTLPRYGEATLPKSLYPDLVANPHSDYGGQQLRAIGALSYRRFWQRRPQLDPAPEVALVAAFHPPLYYRLHAPLFQAVRARFGFRAAVYAVRSVGLLCAAAAVVLVVLPFQRFLGSGAFARAAVLTMSLFPMLIPYIARISSDALALLVVAAVFYLATVPAPRTSRRVALLAAGVGLLLGVGVLVRANVLMWLPIVLVAWWGRVAMRQWPLRHGVLATVVTLACWAGPVWPYMAGNMRLYGQWVPGQEGLAMARQGQTFADCLAAAQPADLWAFFWQRMVCNCLWKSGWSFRAALPGCYTAYQLVILACLVGAAAWCWRRPRLSPAAVDRERAVVCAAAWLFTALGAYAHALSSRVAYGSVVTPSYYIMPAILPFLALLLKAARGWPGRAMRGLCVGAMAGVFVFTEFHSLFRVAAVTWSASAVPAEMFARLATVHPLFPSPAGLALLLPLYALVAVLLAASVGGALAARTPAASAARPATRRTAGLHFGHGC